MMKQSFTIVGYILLGALIAGLTILLVAMGQGYSYSFKTHRWTQNGLVIIQSVPSGLMVTLDNKRLKKKTPYRQSFGVGKYDFELSKDGYFNWRKTVDVVASEVSLLEYVILMPRDPHQKTLDSQAAIIKQSLSRDHRHLAYITGGPNPTVFTLDLGNPKAVKLWSPPAATPETPAESLSNVQWSDDASHLLITTTTPTGDVTRLIAASGGEATNLTTKYGVVLGSPHFAGNNWRQIYFLAPDGLRRIDAEAQSLSAVLSDKAKAFYVTNDRVIYVEARDAARSLWNLDSRGRRQQILAALPESDSYDFAYGSYEGQDELVIVPSKTRTATLYSDIFSASPTSRVLAHDVDSALFAPDFRRVVLSSATSATMVTFDFDRAILTDRQPLFSFADSSGPLTAVTWYDSYHLLQNRGGRLIWSEFDGANRQDIGPVATGLAPFSSADQKSLYYIASAADGAKVKQLIVKQ